MHARWGPATYLSEMFLAEGLGFRNLLSRVRASCIIMRWHKIGSRPGSCDESAAVGRKWIQDLTVALCNPLPVWPVFQVLVSNGWFQSSAKPWRTSFQASYGSLQFVITPILAPKNGSGWDWQNPSCCRDAKSWELGALLYSVLAVPSDRGVVHAGSFTTSEPGSSQSVFGACDREQRIFSSTFL